MPWPASDIRGRDRLRGEVGTFGRPALLRRSENKQDDDFLPPQAAFHETAIVVGAVAPERHRRLRNNLEVAIQTGCR